MLSPKHKQEIKKLLQKVYHPLPNARKKVSPAERFLAGSSAPSFTATSRQPTSSLRGNSSVRTAPRSSQRSTAPSNERTAKKPSDWSAMSPSGGNPPPYQLVLQGQQGDPKFSLHSSDEDPRRGPATYDSNTLKQLLAEAGEAAAQHHPEQLLLQHTQQAYLPAPQLQKEVLAQDSDTVECEQERGSDQLKSALFDYYLQRELSRHHRESPSKGEAELEQIQRHFAPPELSELELEESEKEASSEEDPDPLPDPPFIEEARPPYYNERIEQELLEFKSEIDYRFKHSEINRCYRFPRTEAGFLRDQEERERRKRDKERRRKEAKLRRKQQLLAQKRAEVERKWKAIAAQAIEAAKVAATLEARRILAAAEEEPTHNNVRTTRLSPKRVPPKPRRPMPFEPKRSPLPNFDEFLMCRGGTLKGGGSGGGAEEKLVTSSPPGKRPHSTRGGGMEILKSGTPAGKHNKNKTYEFPVEMLKSLGDQALDEPVLSTTDKYQKTIDFSKLQAQYRQQQRSESVKRSQHVRGQSMAQYRSVSSTKHAQRPPQKIQNFIAAAGRRSELGKKAPQSTKEATRPRSLKLAFQPANGAAQRAITISSGGGMSAQNTAKKEQQQLGAGGGVARQHAFQQIPATVLNATLKAPASSRSQRPASNRGTRPESTRKGLQSETGYSSKPRVNLSVRHTFGSAHSRSKTALADSYQEFMASPGGPGGKKKRGVGGVESSLVVRQTSQSVMQRRGWRGGESVGEKFATLKKELSKINQNLKQTIRRMNSNARSAVNSSREGSTGREAAAAIRISELLLNSQR